jgi:nucleoside-diphosphate-sugar epimerase
MDGLLSRRLLASADVVSARNRPGGRRGVRQTDLRDRWMRILITGNMGYVGPVLARHLRQRDPNVELIGFDASFFAHCLTGAMVFPESLLDKQYFGDIRDFPEALLSGVDAVVHLAAISNDPMGVKFEAVTDEINYKASVRIADLARRNGVKNFVFASSCSVYGAASRAARTEADEVNPLTAYARSKIATERALEALDNGSMIITCLRFATACGMSDRLRLDLVLNDFAACAIALGEITVLSDGTPWRPLIDVKDMARAIEWAAVRSVSSGGEFLVVNAGADVWNYQVKDLAEAVAEAVPGTKVSINTSAPPDKRSYRVDFSRFASLAPDHVPQVTLGRSIEALKAGLVSMGFADGNFRNSQNIRLKVLDGHIASRRLLPSLRWRQSV